MDLRFNVISADDHVQETPDLWTQRLSKEKWGDNIPHVAKQPDGSERWVINGEVQEQSALAATGALFESRHHQPTAWKDVPKASYDPQERLKAMDQDGIDIQVLYPTVCGVSGEVLGAIKDPALQEACVQAYNDWLLETWGDGNDGRFVPQCIVPLTSIEAATKEAERAVKKGHKGVIMSPVPWHVNPELPHIHLPEWDSLWAKVRDLGVPICWHSGSVARSIVEIYDKYTPARARAFDSVRQPLGITQLVGMFMLSGFGERLPDVKVVFGTTTLNWITFQLELCDHEWERSMLIKDGVLTKPSEVFHRQCYVTTWFDTAGLSNRAYIGLDNILWQSEFPRETSTFPRSAETIKKNFEGISEPDRGMILHGNAGRLYGIS